MGAWEVTVNLNIKTLMIYMYEACTILSTSKSIELLDVPSIFSYLFNKSFWKFPKDQTMTTFPVPKTY